MQIRHLYEYIPVASPSLAEVMGYYKRAVGVDTDMVSLLRLSMILLKGSQQTGSNMQYIRE